MSDHEPLLPPHGGYRKLKSFQIAQLVYDVTVRFCGKYIPPSSRTRDQMVQAARSGVQNIAEGSRASGTSRKMELKLTNVARSSLEELRLDYEDFLRHRNLSLWEGDDPRRKALIQHRCRNADDVARWVRDEYRRGVLKARTPEHGPHGPHGPHGQNDPRETASVALDREQSRGEPTPSIGSIGSIPPTIPEISANAVLTLIAVASSLLGRQLKAQSEVFEEHGGFTERLYRRRSRRSRS